MRMRRAAGLGGASGGALAGTGTVRGVLRVLLLLVAATSFLYPLLTLLQASRPDEQNYRWHMPRSHAPSPPRAVLANAALWGRQRGWPLPAAASTMPASSPIPLNLATTTSTSIASGAPPVLPVDNQAAGWDTQRRSTSTSPPPATSSTSVASVMGASSEVGAGAAAAGTSRDVAIGVAKGLKAEAIRTYVMTLRQFSQADVFLYVDALPADMPAYDGVHFLLFDQQKLPHPWHRYHPSSYRYHLYHEFMQTTGRQYERVQACDIRDVAFQADPFESVPPGDDAVHIFQEDASMTIGKCGTNSGWIRACYGVAAHKLAAQPISCSGYAIGGAAAMARYFEVMAGEIGEKTHCEQNGIDQGMHNVLVNAALADWAPTHGKKYTGLPSFVSHTNERGPVYTGGYAPKGVYSQTKQGVFLNSDGDVYRVLHQYDRHVYMTEALAAVVSRLGAAGSHRRVPLQQPPAAAATTAAVAQVSTAAAGEGESAPRRRALVFVVQFDPAQQSWFKSRHSGEIEFVNTLADTLESFGWAVTQSGEISQVRAYVDALLADGAALARTHLFLDVATATNFYEHPAWARLRCHVRVLDFFGTPTPGALGLNAQAQAAGLAPKQFWTPYPNQWNTHVGFPVQVGAPPLKKRQGMLWGKLLKYFAGHKELIRQLARLSPLHAVVEDAVDNTKWLREAGVTVHGLMQPAQWEELVAESAYMIGFGDPILGPSVMHCLAVGTPYLDPVYPSPKTVPSGMAFTSQHSFALSFGAPLVYPVHLDDTAEVLRTVQQVLTSPPQAPFVPAVMTPEGYMANLKTLMDMSFCASK